VKRREILKHLGAAIPALAVTRYGHAAAGGAPKHEAMARGPFAPNWDSLAEYRTPDWFRNAKFGIWAHWGPQCEPELATGMRAPCMKRAAMPTSIT